tara:strand:+ start:3013 stop:3741 length:729 start_codon:yes stop_codon:yes gene_type:complete
MAIIPKPIGPDVFKASIGKLSTFAGPISNPKNLIQGVGSALAPLLNKVIRKNERTLKNNIQIWVTGRMYAQDEVQALMSSSSPNSLNAMLGITPAEGAAAVRAIINEIVRSIQINISKIDKNLNGSFDIQIVDADMDKIANFAVGQKNIGKSFLSLLGSSESLNWLYWLLIRGDSPIIIGHRYIALAGEGRTGGGVMRPGGSFRIPPEYSGIETDNFITRAFSDELAQKELSSIIQKHLFKQ